MGQKGEKFVDANDRDWLGLHDRVCVITGAASGIGRETAIQFATVGASPDISHYLCMIEQVCATICSVFCRRTALWRRMTRDSLGLFRGCGCSDDEVSVGL